METLTSLLLRASHVLYHSCWRENINSRGAPAQSVMWPPHWMISPFFFHTAQRSLTSRDPRHNIICISAQNKIFFYKYFVNISFLIRNTPKFLILNQMFKISGKFRKKFTWNFLLQKFCKYFFSHQKHA